MKTYFEPILEIYKVSQDDVVKTSSGVVDFDDKFSDDDWD